MLKVVKTPPLATVVALRSPGTKGKVEEKKYHRSISLLKFGSEVTSSAQTFTKILTRYKCSSIWKACSSILSYGLFWGIIYGITVSFLKRSLNASSGTTTTTIMLAYYLTWMMEPIASLIFGCLFAIWMSNPQKNSATLTRQFWATLLSAALLVGSSVIFFVYIPRLGDESSEVEIILSTILTVFFFAAMMISINGYMSAINFMTQPEASNTAHYGLTSGLNAVGQMIATSIIIIYFGLNNNNNSVDNIAPAILGVGFVFISIFIIISLTCDQYWPCCGSCMYDECCLFDQSWVPVYWYFDLEPPSDDGRYVVVEEVGTWLVFLFVTACWIALFAFLPWSVDWYASTYYSENVGSPEYNRGVWIASWARFYQQLVMAGCSFFMLFVSKCFFKNNLRWNWRREELKFRTMWILTLIGLTVYSACLLVAALTDNPDLAYAAFIVSGIGMAAIFPLNGFQSYCIFSFNVKKREHTTTIMDNNNNNNTIVALPFACTDYYDNRQKINAAAMIGQIIILSVTYFAFHFNYKWVLVTGSAAGGIAIFLGMLLIVVRSFKNVAVVYQ
jgi:hypothetical protein